MDANDVPGLCVEASVVLSELEGWLELDHLLELRGGETHSVEAREVPGLSVEAREVPGLSVEAKEVPGLSVEMLD